MRKAKKCGHPSKSPLLTCKLAPGKTAQISVIRETVGDELVLPSILSSGFYSFGKFLGSQNAPPVIDLSDMVITGARY